MRIKLFILFFLIGWMILGASFFAEFIGLDNDAGWGRGRIALLILGSLTLVTGVVLYLFTDDARSTFIVHKVRSWLTQRIARTQKFIQCYRYTLPAAVFVMLVYVWFASSGSWTHWVSATRYYADLANGFQRGQLHLPTRPNPELLSLTNPYDPLSRQGLTFPIDYSLFNERFYIYWGPVPALILVLLNAFIPGKVGDLFLAFGFISGIFGLQYSLLIIIWERFFQNSPRWLLLLSVSISGLSGPWMYMLVNEPNGRIYEAAIAGAQFFLLAGLVIVIGSLAKSRLSHFSLAMAGLLLGLSIGTRLVIAIPIGFVCIVIAYQIWRSTKPSLKDFTTKLMALGLPLVVCLIGMGWYNWARFGSVTETGLAYSLAHQDMLLHRDNLFSPIYIIQNLYNYILNPPVFTTQFPFFNSKGMTENIVPLLYSLPEVYQSQPITGLLYFAPFTVFAGIPIIMAFKKMHPTTVADDDKSRFYNSINVTLFCTFFSAFCFLLIFFWSALRYMGDFMPEIILVSIMGFWHGHQFLEPRPLAQKIYSLLGIILATMGAVMSILIALSANQYG